MEQGGRQWCRCCSYTFFQNMFYNIYKTIQISDHLAIRTFGLWTSGHPDFGHLTIRISDFQTLDFWPSEFWTTDFRLLALQTSGHLDYLIFELPAIQTSGHLAFFPNVLIGTFWTYLLGQTNLKFLTSSLQYTRHSGPNIPEWTRRKLHSSLEWKCFPSANWISEFTKISAAAVGCFPSPFLSLTLKGFPISG